MKLGEAGPLLVKKGEFARLRGCSAAYVTKLTKPGGALYGTAALLPDGRINVGLAEQVLGPAVPTLAGAIRAGREVASLQGPGAAAASREARAAFTADESPATLQAGATLTAAGARILGDKERRERAQADTAEFEARRQRRELVEAAAVEEPQFDTMRVLRNRVLAVPPARAEELAAMGDARAIEARLLDWLEEALRGAQAELDRLAAEEDAEAARLDALLEGEAAA